MEGDLYLHIHLYLWIYIYMLIYIYICLFIYITRDHMAEGGTDSILGCWEKLGHVWGVRKRHQNHQAALGLAKVMQRYQAGEGLLEVALRQLTPPSQRRVCLDEPEVLHHCQT